MVKCIAVIKLAVLAMTMPAAAWESWISHVSDTHAVAVSPIAFGDPFGESTVGVTCGAEYGVLSIFVSYKNWSRSLMPEPTKHTQITVEWTKEGVSSLPVAYASWLADDGLFSLEGDTMAFVQQLIGSTSLTITFDTTRYGPVNIRYSLDGAKEVIERMLGDCAWETADVEQYLVATSPSTFVNSIGNSRIVVSCLGSLGTVRATIRFESDPSAKSTVKAKWNRELPKRLAVAQRPGPDKTFIWTIWDPRPEDFVERLASATSFAIRFDTSEYGQVTIYYNLSGSKEAIDACREYASSSAG